MAKKKVRKGTKKAKKPVKKSTKKKAVSKVKVKKVRKVKKTKPHVKVVKPKVKQEGKLIGKITHFFPLVNAAVLVVSNGSLKVGDTILIKGHTTQLKETITSMQIDHVAITEAKKCDEIGLLVAQRVREHDEVYKLVPRQD